MTSIPGRRLGKLAPRHDARTYKLAPALAARLPDVPQARDWSVGVAYQMWGNDRYGCCAFAAQAALTLTWTNAAQAPVSLTTAQVLQNYSMVTGFNPATGANDNGTVLLDELNFWRKNGLDQPGQTLSYLTAYGSIPVADTDGIRRSIAYLGGVLAGVQVPQGFLSLPLGATWDLNAVADRTPVGGHAIAVTGYTPEGLFFNTWGARTFMPWATFTAIVDEVYGLLTRQHWLGIDGVSPNREDFNALVSELATAGR